MLDSTERQNPTYYEEVIRKGYSRRDFLSFCTTIAAYMGLSQSGIAQVTEAMKTKPRLPVIWLHFQECTCCSESFIRSSHPIVADVLLDQISLDYSETLMAASGVQAEEAMQQTMKKYKGEYILCVEGSVPTAADGVYCMIGGKTSIQILEEAAENAKAVIAWGSCAKQRLCAVSQTKTLPKQLRFIKSLKVKPSLKCQDALQFGEVMAAVIVHVVTFGRIPELDRLGRPKAFYSKRVHDSCYRRSYYDAGLFVESFDDANAKKGYCLYKVGCKGPVTYNSCGTVKWNGGVSFPIQSGHGCIGCSEENYWDAGKIYERSSIFPGFGIEANADTVGKVALGAVAIGAAAHVVMTNINKKKIIKELESEGKAGEGEL